MSEAGHLILTPSPYPIVALTLNLTLTMTQYDERMMSLDIKTNDAQREDVARIGPIIIIIVIRIICSKQIPLLLTH